MQYRKREQKELKPSGVEWLGDIPIKWKKTNLRNFLKSKIVDGPHETPRYVDKGIPFISVDSLNERELVDLEKVKKFISDAQYDIYNKKTKLEKNDLLFTKSATIGKVAIMDDRKFMTWSPIAIIKSDDEKIYYKNLFYILKSNRYIDYIKSLSNLNTQLNIGMGILEKSQIVASRDLEEQQKIANFLDEKSKVFDTAISKKEELITRLELAKQSLIDEVVAGKLKVIEKDGKLQTIKRQKEELEVSKIDWLGDIPKDWQVKKLKYFTYKITSGSTPLGGASTYVDKGIPFLRSQNIHFNGLSLEKVSFISNKVHENMKRSQLKGKDILINITGASIGRVTYIPEDFKEGNVNQHVCIVRINHKEAYYKYISMFLSTNYGQNQVFVNQVGTSREGLTFEDLGNFSIIFPNIEEQKQILKYLDEKIKTFDNTIEKTKQSITKLKEAKETLISEAVTGKIEIL